ncbi:DUF2281 domain-containing protein (plasmid) [Cyanobacterium sp. IPPAS B-1200]|uniref:DUF2281 domain-containing protein n=1 Tax=Cyanobacterium sp. IPPAS B-1200 TaxID=1562720 RepID=UPI0008525F62|nr:DUF2281 domain-containing protein [Cyanobacterium sp. IPPAS B-1200]OEJ78420.1 hypothetical protein A5482_13315 [Cyanobacterium sp. IPPAS B-1200]
MNTEQILINKWRLLPPEKQEEVIDFVSFLEQNYIHNKSSEKTRNLELENSKLNSPSLEGTLIYYEDPYEPVAVEDWEAMM